MSLFKRTSPAPGIVYAEKTGTNLPKPSFEERLGSLAAEEAYAQDLLDTAKRTLNTAAVDAADLAADVDDEVRRLFEYKSHAEVLSGRAAFLADNTAENVALVRS